MSDAKKYLVAVDGSEWAERAAKFAFDLAGQTGATVKLATIIPWSGFTPMSLEDMHARPLVKEEEERTAREEILAPLIKIAEDAGINVEVHFDWGHPVKKLHKLVEKDHIDMVIAGRRGRSKLADLVMGSVANSLAHSETVPILLVP